MVKCVHLFIFFSVLFLWPLFLLLRKCENSSWIFFCSSESQKNLLLRSLSAVRLCRSEIWTLKNLLAVFVMVEKKLLLQQE